MVPRHFIVPAAPRSQASPPLGVNWEHEIKYDGWRLQIHYSGGEVQFLSRAGNDLTQRFAQLARKFFRRLAAEDCIIDAEIAALDLDGGCDYKALHFRRKGARLCIRAFDLLALNGVDLKPLALDTRRARLEELVKKSRVHALWFSPGFSDPVELLAEAERLGLEGIVSKNKSERYLSGSRCRWVQVQTEAWRIANADRHKLFMKAP